jgi:hypothetical protein
MYWESSEDGVEGIIQAVTGVLQGDGPGIDRTLNHLSYPNSTYDNLRNGMPNSTSAPPSSILPVLSSTTGTLLPSSTASIMSCSVGSTFFLCPQGVCMCALDPTHHPSCLVIQAYCYNKLCSDNSACDPGEICWTDELCDDGAHCIPVVVGGCITNPVVTALVLSPVATGSG